MGAWGTAVFDNDEAADFAGEIESAGTFEALRELLDHAFTIVLNADEFLENPDASAGVAAAALVAAWDKPALLGDRAYAPEVWPMFDQALPEALRIRAGQTLDRVLRPGEDNEHFLLWDEAGEWETVTAEIERYRAALP